MVAIPWELDDTDVAENSPTSELKRTRMPLSGVPSASIKIASNSTSSPAEVRETEVGAAFSVSESIAALMSTETIAGTPVPRIAVISPLPLRSPAT